MQIRRAALADTRSLARLNGTVQALHAQMRPGIFKPPVISDELITWFESLLEEADNCVFIAEADGEAIGYMIAVIVHRPENPFTYAMDYLLIEQISVNPEYQRKGCGKKLLDSAYELARAENMKRVVLGVWNFNIHAIEFYKGQGFHVFDERMELDLL